MKERPDTDKYENTWHTDPTKRDRDGGSVSVALIRFAEARKEHLI